MAWCIKPVVPWCSELWTFPKSLGAEHSFSQCETQVRWWFRICLFSAFTWNNWAHWILFFVRMLKPPTGGAIPPLPGAWNAAWRNGLFQLPLAQGATKTILDGERGGHRELVEMQDGSHYSKVMILARNIHMIIIYYSYIVVPHGLLGPEGLS